MNAVNPLPPNVSDTFVRLKPRSEWPNILVMVVIGGLVTRTFLTLMVLPALYGPFNREERPDYWAISLGILPLPSVIEKMLVTVCCYAYHNL
jgi:Cu/Ag efflux pump CusA